MPELNTVVERDSANRSIIPHTFSTQQSTRNGVVHRNSADCIAWNLRTNLDEIGHKFIARSGQNSV